MGITKKNQGNCRVCVVRSRPTCMVLDLDGELLQVLVMLHVLVDSLADEFGTVFAVLLFPFGILLLSCFLCLLLFGC